MWCQGSTFVIPVFLWLWGPENWWGPVGLEGSVMNKERDPVPKMMWRAGKMAQQVKGACSKHNDLSSIPETHVAEGGNWFPKSLPDFHTWATIDSMNKNINMIWKLKLLRWETKEKQDERWGWRSDVILQSSHMRCGVDTLVPYMNTTPTHREKFIWNQLFGLHTILPFIKDERKFACLWDKKCRLIFTQTSNLTWIFDCAGHPTISLMLSELINVCILICFTSIYLFAWVCV